MNIAIINGPNINMLGIREPDIYGKDTYQDLLSIIDTHSKTKNINITVSQSNHEGAIIDTIQGCLGHHQGIIINGGGYTHTSIAIMDALKGVGIPIVEVHLSDIANREPFRHHSYISMVADGVVMGKGIHGYIEAIDLLYCILQERSHQ